MLEEAIDNQINKIICPMHVSLSLFPSMLAYAQRTHEQSGPDSRDGENMRLEGRDFPSLSLVQLVPLWRAQLLNSRRQHWVPRMGLCPWGPCQQPGSKSMTLGPYIMESVTIFFLQQSMFQIRVCFLFLQQLCHHCHLGNYRISFLFPLLGSSHVASTSKGNEATRAYTRQIVFDPLHGSVHITYWHCYHPSHLLWLWKRRLAEFG